MVSTNSARRFIVLVAVILVVLVFIQYFDRKNNRDKELIISEIEACVVSLCISDKTLGEDCIVQKPKLSKIRLTVDENGHRRVLITPTEIDCR